MLFNIQCIVLDKRYRADEVSILGELSSLGFSPNLYLVGDGSLQTTYQHIDVDPPGIGPEVEDYKRCRQSYNYGLCVRDIMEKHLASEGDILWMFEDDAILNQPKFSMYWEQAWSEVANTDLINWFDVLYVGGNHTCGEMMGLNHIRNDGTVIPLKYTYKTSYSLDLHSSIFSRRGCQKILEKQANPRYTFDGIIGQMQLDRQINVLAFHPSLVTQKPGFSYNEFRPVDRASNHYL